MAFVDQLVELQKALSDIVVPCEPKREPRGRFWRIGTSDEVRIEVVDEGFDSGVSSPCYVADKGQSVIITQTDVATVMRVLPETLRAARAERRFWHEDASFDAALPHLMEDPNLNGRWVVYCEEAVQHHASTREAAHHWATTHMHGRPCVVGQVARAPVYRIGGARRSVS